MMKKVIGDGLGGKGIQWLPNNEVFSHVILWMHDIGDTADGWASSMPSLGKYFRFYFVF